MKFPFLLFFCLFCLNFPLSSPVHAQDTEVGNWSFGLNFGVGQRSTFIVNQDNLNFYVLPDIHYYGERLFFDNGTLGYTLFEKRNYALSAISELNPYGFYFDQSAFGESFDRLYVVRVEQSNIQSSDQVASSEEFTIDDGNFDFQAGIGPTENGEQLVDKELLTKIHKPGFSLDAGLQINWFFDTQQVTLKLVTDISSQHGGSRARLQWTKSNKFGDFGMLWGLGLDWLDKTTSSYYFAVNTSNPDLNLTKRLSNTTNPFVSLTTSYPMTRKLFLVAHLKYLMLDNKISDSPIVREDHSLTQFVGINYKF